MKLESSKGPTLPGPASSNTSKVLPFWSFKFQVKTIVVPIGERGRVVTICLSYPRVLDKNEAMETTRGASSRPGLLSGA